MKKDLLNPYELKKYFIDRGYNYFTPHKINEVGDTVFLTAGIQAILTDYRNGKIGDLKKIYISQPVVRTQFTDMISEGSSIAFINSTTAGLNISKNEHNEMVKEWLRLFCMMGMEPKNISFKKKDYERNWGDLLVSGEKTFYYYNNIELGDTTFFTKISKDNQSSIGLETMSDIGFGLERIRWCLSNESYYNLYSNSEKIPCEIKGLLSAIALLAVNDIIPTNKNAGYRARLFSKKLVEQLEARDLTTDMRGYLCECIKYWKEWQNIDKEIDVEIINREYIRNGNRYIINKLDGEGYKNINGININISREEFKKRLIGSGVESNKVEELFINKSIYRKPKEKDDFER